MEKGWKGLGLGSVHVTGPHNHPFSKVFILNNIFYIFTWYNEVLTHCEHLWITISLWMRCGGSSDQFDFDRSTTEKQLFLVLHNLLALQAISTSSSQNTKNIRLILPLPPAEISHYEKSHKSSLSGKDMNVFRL